MSETIFHDQQGVFYIFQTDLYDTKLFSQPITDTYENFLSRFSSEDQNLMQIT